MKINGSIFESKDVKTLALIIENAMKDQKVYLEQRMELINSKLDSRFDELKQEIGFLREQIKTMKQNRTKVNFALLSALLSFVVAVATLLLSQVLK